MAMNYISVEAAKVIEDEIRKLIEGGEQTAKQILEEYRDDLHAVAKGLLEFETLSSADVKEILKGNQPHRESDDDPGLKVSAVPATGKPASSSGGEMKPQPS